MSADAGHPAERRGPQEAQPSLVLLLGALAAGPTGWVLQLVLDYGISSYACFPRDTPALATPPPGWAGEPVLLLAINLACLALVLAGLAFCMITWSRERGERPADAGRIRGRILGRTRFLAACGVFSGAGFAMAVLFDTLPILLAPACWSIAS